MLMRDLLDHGIVKTIIISGDYYVQLSEDEIHHLNGLMECSSRFRWVINTEKQEYINFIYTQYPYREKNEVTTDI